MYYFSAPLCLQKIQIKTFLFKKWEHLTIVTHNKGATFYYRISYFTCVIIWWTTRTRKYDLSTMSIKMWQYCLYFYNFLSISILYAPVTHRNINKRETMTMHIYGVHNIYVILKSNVNSLTATFMNIHKYVNLNKYTNINKQ